MITDLKAAFDAIDDQGYDDFGRAVDRCERAVRAYRQRHPELAISTALALLGSMVSLEIEEDWPWSIFLAECQGPYTGEITLAERDHHVAVYSGQDREIVARIMDATLLVSADYAVLERDQDALHALLYTVWQRLT